MASHLAEYEDVFNKYGIEVLAAAVLIDTVAKPMTNESIQALAIAAKKPIIRDVIAAAESELRPISRLKDTWPLDLERLRVAGGDTVAPYIKTIRAHLKLPSAMYKFQYCIRPGVCDAPNALTHITYYKAKDTAPVMTKTACGRPAVDGEYVLVRFVLFGAPGKASTTIDLCRRRVSDLTGFVRIYETAP